MPGKIVQGMFAVEKLVANSPGYDWKAAVLMISKGILAEAMPPRRGPGLYGFKSSRRRMRYSEIAYSRCARSMLGQMQD